MITGAHAILYSADAEADKAFFKDVLQFPYVDVGHGWLIFGLPPSEIAVHPAEQNGPPEIYLLCDDINAFVKDMEIRQVPCSSITRQRWGDVVQITLPGGGKIGIYEPKHARP
jgi:hypothetical protein